MNEALVEFAKKNIDYTWAALAQLAKDHIDPEQLIEDIYMNGYIDGSRDSGNKAILQAGLILTPIVLVGGYYGKKFFDKQKGLEEEIERLNDENAELKAKAFAKEFESIVTDDNTDDNVIWGYFQSEDEEELFA